MSRSAGVDDLQEHPLTLNNLLRQNNTGDDVSLHLVDHLTVRAPVFDLELPEGATKWGFVSGCKAGLRHHHDSHPESKESQIRALEKGCHQSGSPHSI